MLYANQEGASQCWMHFGGFMSFMYMFFKVWEFVDFQYNGDAFDWLPYQLRLSTQRDYWQEQMIFDEATFEGGLWFGWIGTPKSM